MNVGTTKRIVKMNAVIEIACRRCGSMGRSVPNGFTDAASGVAGAGPSIGPSVVAARDSVSTFTIVASSSRTVNGLFAGEDVRLMSNRTSRARAPRSVRARGC